MYIDDLKALKIKLEKQQAERLRVPTPILDTVNVPLNRLEIEFVLQQIEFLTRRAT